MDINTINAYKPAFPNERAQVNTNVKKLLQSFELVKSSKNIHKRLKRCGTLIYKVTSTLRHAEPDHLYQTTSIWVLINLFRMDPKSVKEIMIHSGIPGVLYDILHSRSLTGSTRQYASELCFYLR